MNSLKFLDGTPVPTDYLAMVSRLVRDASLAIDVFGEDELETACQSMASSDGQPQSAPTRPEAR